MICLSAHEISVGACVITLVINLTDAQLLQQAEYRINAAASMVTMHCNRGPVNNCNLEAHAQEIEAGKRLDWTSLGLSCRVGCKAHFAVRVQPDALDITEIPYYKSEHTDACKVGCSESFFFTAT